MAINLSPNSVVNTSNVSGSTATIGIGAGSTINSSTFGQGSVSFGLTTNSLVNNSTIPSHVFQQKYSTNSFVNGSIVSSASVVPKTIYPESIVNQSVITQAIIKANVYLDAEPVINYNSIPSIISQLGIVPQQTITPVTRPTKTIQGQSTGLKKFVFKDISIKGGSHPLTGDLLAVTDVNAIKQSIKNIIMTNPTERFFDEIDFGVGVERFLFKTFNNNLASIVQETILLQLAAHEPRIIVDDITVDGYASENQLYINIVFTIRTTNVTSNVTVLLERT